MDTEPVRTNHKSQQFTDMSYLSDHIKIYLKASVVS